jgi:hypothetical protein
MKLSHPSRDEAEEDYFSGNESAQESGNENQNNDDEAEEVKEKKVVKVRNVIRKPQPKLDATRFIKHKNSVFKFFINKYASL